jgi:hypothetical protein
MNEPATALLAEMAPTSGQIRAVEKQWKLATRIAFRFVCAYWVLYSLPATGRVSFLGIVPGAQLYHAMWQAIATWVAIHAFHLSGPVTVYRQTGSGDTTLDYIHNLCLLVLAIGIAAVWSLVDRKRQDYLTLHVWLRLLVRYTLAFTLLSYGFAKVFPLQFPYPALNRFIQPFGDFSPMGVLWSFMGASPAYTMFAGAAEVTGGILLLFRKTALLGALVSATVLLNVVTLNFCYDVPVKLYSSNLLLMAVFLTAPDLGKLLGFLVLNRSAAPVTVSGPQFGRRWTKVAALAFKVLVVGFFLIQNIVGGYQQYQKAVVHPVRPPLYGIYQVERFIQNGKEIPPLLTDLSRWKMVLAQNPTLIQIRMMDDSARTYASVYGPADNTVILTAAEKGVFTYSRPDAEHVTMTGTLGGVPLVVNLRRKDPSEFLLVNRGFHWINELPFNR